jgi:hypothetical protein
MSTLRSALDEARIRDLRDLSDAELVSHLDELEHADRVLDAERSRAISELERREVWSRDGHLSIASWLGSRHGVAPAAAAGHVRMARVLDAMPVAAAALSSGEVSSAAVSLLAHAREASPDAFSRSEATLVEAARTLPADELTDTVTRWRNEHADEAAEEHQELYLSPTLRSRGRLAGDLNAETTQVLTTALNAVQDAEVRSNDRTDTRSPARRRADALGEISASGSTFRTGRRWRESVPTSSSRSTSRPSAEA